MTDTIAERTAVDLAERPRGGGLVGDAPADADEVLAKIRVWPRWIGLTFALAASLALWAAIVLGVRWALGV